ncbi:MAG: PadR family transcriptional regulator, partial [Nitrososphaerales archaeon]
WRPGPGSVYPMLKKLVSQGFIKAESVKKIKTPQRVYQITPKGKQRVDEIREIFTSAGQKWSAMRRIFIQMLDPKDLGKFFVDGTKLQFDISRETLESKLGGISASEAEFILKEYLLHLQRQLDWANEVLQRVKRDKPDLRIEPKIASK